MFRSEYFFRTTQELEYLFFCRAKREFFFLEFNIRLYDKNSESDYFFFPPPEFFFSNIGNQNIFLEKKHNPPFKLNGRSLTKSKYCRCRRGRDRMIVDLQLPMQSVSITTDVVSSNLDQGEVYNIM